MLGAESAKLNNQARFILEKIDGKIIIGMFLDRKLPVLKLQSCLTSLNIFGERNDREGGQNPLISAGSMYVFHISK